MTIKILIVASLISFACNANANRTVPVVNSCAFTIWPGMHTAGSSVLDQVNGWEQAAGSTVTFDVPDNWSGASIWGRTECDFLTVQGPTSCVTGGCQGGLICTGTGATLATAAELTLSASLLDIHDISVVDSFNLPMTLIASNPSCASASCPVNLNPECPVELQVLDPAGAVVGCNSACSANLDGNPTNSSNCCTGSHNTPLTCPSSQVTDYAFFKNACPDAMVFVYDENLSSLPCLADLRSNYTLTFCP
ncbi:hypothetical protein GYMLUDRAFT_264738 [Collybiopsis luxurians FD-317 M1]|uniref:Thaumatin-like protein n=1 Tax=Collybiopsis luxurians FD-317 M1 TaxID=944289 RepID=A0A0D0AUI6_9AGAR|nr:hypothetical protein GYMLUDRAFT_264738 [Collybiopsis luxurians FD-317 M1]